MELRCHVWFWGSQPKPQNRILDRAVAQIIDFRKMPTPHNAHCMLRNWLTDNWTQIELARTHSALKVSTTSLELTP